MKYETCLFCTQRNKCQASKSLLCNGKQKNDQYDKRDAGIRSFNRKKLRCGSILNDGSIMETYFFDEDNALQLGCVKPDGSLTTIPISNAVNTRKNAYQSADGRSASPDLPDYLSAQGWNTSEARPCKQKFSEINWYITVYRDIYCKSDNIFGCYIVSRDMSIAFHEKNKKKIVKYLNTCSEYYEFNSAKTFVYGVDFIPDMFNVLFTCGKGNDSCPE